MTDKERSKEIKAVVERISHQDINRLIEQAERVRELEKERSEWKDTAQSYYMTNQELREQNKRYRETLEFYANRDNYKLEHFDPNINDYMSTVDYDEGRKARQTIGSEANEIANKALEGDAKE